MMPFRLFAVTLEPAVPAVLLAVRPPTTVVALPRVLMRPRRSTWESPDRGLR